MIQHTYGEQIIYQFKQDGYLQANPMLEVVHKKVDHYLNDPAVLSFLHAPAEEIKVGLEDLVVKRVGCLVPGVYVHPRVALHLAQWVSPDLGVAVSTWVVDWIILDYLSKPNQVQAQSQAQTAPETTPDVAAPMPLPDLVEAVGLTKDMSLAVSGITAAATDTKALKAGEFTKNVSATLTTLLELCQVLTGMISDTVIQRTPAFNYTVTGIDTGVTTPSTPTPTCTSNYSPSTPAVAPTPKPECVEYKEAQTTIVERGLHLWCIGEIERPLTEKEIATISRRAASNYRKMTGVSPAKIRNVYNSGSTAQVNGYLRHELELYVDPYIYATVRA